MWSAEHGRNPDGSRFKPLPFQIPIQDALTDPDVTFVTLKKGARVGYTKGIIAQFIGYSIHQNPIDLMVVQPTVEDAEDYSKDEIAWILDWPAIRGIISDKAKDSSNTIRKKFFRGGSLRLAGANSPRPFRRIDLDAILFDEEDGYPAMAGEEGDQIELGAMRTFQSPQRKVIDGSTPTIEGVSKVSKRYKDGTQETWHVPCPTCGTYQPLVLGDGTGAGITCRDRNDPEGTVFYRCVNGCEIDESEKEEMVAKGRYVAANPDAFKRGHRSFHIWQAYLPNVEAGWGKILTKWFAAKDDPIKLRSFKNLVCGEAYVMKGTAPDWRRLWERSRGVEWPTGTVPNGGLILTIGIDIQKDRIEAACWAWGRDGQCWLVEWTVCMGSPFTREPWTQLAAFVGKTWHNEYGVVMKPVRIFIDAGFATTEVAAFCRLYPKSLMSPCRGMSGFNAPPVSNPKAMDVVTNGKSRRRALKVFGVGDHVLKEELYGRLELDVPGEFEAHPPKFVHLSSGVDEEVCKQLTAERWNEERATWEKNHANEQLDMWKYARAAAIAAGIEKMSDADWAILESQLGADPAPQPQAHRQKPQAAPPPDPQPEPQRTPEPEAASSQARRSLRSWLRR